MIDVHGVRRSVAALAATMAIAFTGTAQAAPCAGFTDVDTSTSYCSAVAWMKSRAITLGCTTTQYCPDQPVTRAQMALFMNRLGNAMIPQFFTKRVTVPDQSLPTIGSIDTGCVVTVPAASFSRNAHVSGGFWGRASSNGARLTLLALQDGTSQSSVGNLSIPVAQEQGSTAWFSADSLLALEPGSEYEVKLVIRNFSGLSVSITGGPCLIDLMVVPA